MDVLQILKDLGFDKAEVTGNSKGVSTVRVRTLKGWVYQRFSTEDQVESWAKYHKPEPNE
jgi:hypothetical protein